MTKYQERINRKQYENAVFDICLWDIQFSKKDEEGNTLKNKDGSIKLFQVVRDIDLSHISEYVKHEDLEEIKEKGNGK